MVPRIRASPERLKQLAAAEGLTMTDRAMTCNSQLAQELGVWATEKGRGPAFHAATFRAYLTEGKVISDPAALAGIAASAGLDSTEARRGIDERSCREAVDREWAASRAAQVAAVPTCDAGGRKVVGAPPYEQLARLVEQAGAKRRPAGTGDGRACCEPSPSAATASASCRRPSRTGRPAPASTGHSVYRPGRQGEPWKYPVILRALSGPERAERLARFRERTPRVCASIDPFGRLAAPDGFLWAPLPGVADSAAAARVARDFLERNREFFYLTGPPPAVRRVHGEDGRACFAEPVLQSIDGVEVGGTRIGIGLDRSVFLAWGGHDPESRFPTSLNLDPLDAPSSLPAEILDPRWSPIDAPSTSARRAGRAGRSG